MELKSGHEQLVRVNRRIDTLVSDIRSELLSRSDTTRKLDTGTIESLLRGINNPLKNFQIDGDEAILDDMIDLYDKVIKQLDEIVTSRKYSENEPLEPSEIDSFKEAKEILEQGRDSKVGIIDKIYTEIIQEDRRGELLDTYIGRKTSDIDLKISNANKALEETRNPIMQFYQDIEPELKVYNEMRRKAAVIKIYNTDIGKLEANVANPSNTAQQRNEFQQQLDTKLQQKAEYIYRSNPKYAEEESLKRGEHESLKDYAERLERQAFEPDRDKAETQLSKKIIPFLGKEVKVAEVDTTTGKFVVTNAKIEDRYFPASIGALDLDPDEIKAFAGKIEQDISYIQAVTDKQVAEKSKLEAEKAEFLHETEEMSLALKTPYEVKESGKEPGRFGKWIQRRAFLRENPDLKSSIRGLSGEEKKSFLEEKMLKQKQREVSTLDRSAVLKDIEKQHTKNPFKDAIKANVRTNIYKNYDKQRQQQQQSRRDER